MASGQIRMTPDTMRGRAGESRTEAENVQNVIDKMDRLLDTLLTDCLLYTSAADPQKK